ncbi:MAG: LysR substrate-binding domain-containing protein [Zavarzinia sp.]|nr:LysR substrate-binding domain-containing protein [Zavarzinia sp.]
MNVRQLLAVKVILATGTMTRAAETLKVSQPAISQMVANLEREIGFMLFERKGTQLTPTAEAIEFAKEAEQAILSLDRMTDVASGIREKRRGALSLAVHARLAGGFLTEAIERFRMLSPGVAIRLTALSSEEVPLSFLRNQIDLWVLEGAVEHALIDGGHHDCEGVCVMTPDDPLAQQAAIMPEMLRGRPLLVAIGSPLAARLESLCRGRCPTAGAVVEAESYASVCALASTGLGIGFTDGVTARRLAALGLVARPFRPALACRIEFLHRNDRPLSEAARGFLQLLRPDGLAGDAATWPTGRPVESGGRRDELHN